MGVKNWKLAGNNLDSTIDAIQRKYALPRLIALFFASRGIEDVQDFLNPRLSNLSDPYRFPRIRDAAKRLWEAIAHKETILIHGDYDTDGITASALLALVLRQNGANVHSFIPHRFDDGYGFTPESLQKALDTYGPASVLVTVDCGITSCDAVNEAVRRGIDVIVTDHHEAGPQLPDAIAIVNPKVYPELEDLQLLAGAGAAFKLSHAFIKYGRENNLGGFQTRLEEVLDYVALGTVADIVPLLGENRIMVKYGIEALRRQIRPGVRALIESSRLRSELTPADITFRMAPRINAAGRVGDANVALQLLESEHIVEAYHCASQLETFNRIRQEKEQEIYQEACEQIERNLAWQSEYSLLVAGRDWHQGVIGIVASRLARDYNRPTIVLTIQGDVAYGSGRSVACLNLVEVLSHTAGLLDRYGGHPMAASASRQTGSPTSSRRWTARCVNRSPQLISRILSAMTEKHSFMNSHRNFSAIWRCFLRSATATSNRSTGSTRCRSFAARRSEDLTRAGLFAAGPGRAILSRSTVTVLSSTGRRSIFLPRRR